LLPFRYCFVGQLFFFLATSVRERSLPEDASQRRADRLTCEVRVHKCGIASAAADVRRAGNGPSPPATVHASLIGLAAEALSPCDFNLGRFDLGRLDPANLGVVAA
jgi:hypothetical protein